MSQSPVPRTQTKSHVLGSAQSPAIYPVGTSYGFGIGARSVPDSYTVTRVPFLAFGRTPVRKNSFVIWVEGVFGTVLVSLQKSKIGIRREEPKMRDGNAKDLSRIFPTEE